MTARSTRCALVGLTATALCATALVDGSAGATDTARFDGRTTQHLSIVFRVSATGTRIPSGTIAWRCGGSRGEHHTTRFSGAHVVARGRFGSDGVYREAGGGPFSRISASLRGQITDSTARGTLRISATGRRRCHTFVRWTARTRSLTLAGAEKALQREVDATYGASYNLTSVAAHCRVVTVAFYRCSYAATSSDETASSYRGTGTVRRAAGQDRVSLTEPRPG